MPAHFLAYVALALLVVIAPGPDFAVVLKNCVMYGRTAGLLTSFGVVSSLLIQGIAAALGVAALVVGSAIAFTVLKIVGAAYLCYLGVLALRAALARRKAGVQETPAAEVSTGQTRRVLRRCFRQGLLSNITNPKVLAFYFSLLPQFVDPAYAALPQVLLLAATHAVFALLWLLLVVAVLDRLRLFLRRPRVRRAIEGITGVALVGLGIRLATASSGG